MDDEWCTKSSNSTRGLFGMRANPHGGRSLLASVAVQVLDCWRKLSAIIGGALKRRGVRIGYTAVAVGGGLHGSWGGEVRVRANVCTVGSAECGVRYAVCRVQSTV
jgi:hypothetical protein